MPIETVQPVWLLRPLPLTIEIQLRFTIAIRILNEIKTNETLRQLEDLHEHIVSLNMSE